MAVFPLVSIVPVLLLPLLLPAPASAVGGNADARSGWLACPTRGPECVAQRWAEAMAAGTGVTASQESFVFTIIHVLHSLSPAHPGDAVVHTIGASSQRELRFLPLFSRLCEPDMNPNARSVHVVLVGPDMDPSEHGQSTQVGNPTDAYACGVTVSRYNGVYGAGVGATFPTAATPDVVIGFNVDAYTCSFRPTLQFLLEHRLNTVLTFYHPHEPQWVLEMLAEPGGAFGATAKQECADALKDKIKGAPPGVAAMFEGSLADWVEGPEGIYSPSELDLLLPTEAVPEASGSVYAYVDNNPFGGQRGIGSGPGRPSIRGSVPYLSSSRFLAFQ